MCPIYPSNTYILPYTCITLTWDMDKWLLSVADSNKALHTLNVNGFIIFFFLMFCSFTKDRNIFLSSGNLQKRLKRVAFPHIYPHRCFSVNFHRLAGRLTGKRSVPNQDGHVSHDDYNCELNPS